MSAKLKHTLTNLEVTPPDGAWPAIAARLDEEYDAGEAGIANRLYDWEAIPPANTFNNILTGLQQAPQAPGQRRAIVIPFRKIAIAAAVTGLLVTGGWYFLSNTTNNEPGDNLATVDNTTAPITGGNNELPDNDAIRPTQPSPVKINRPLRGNVNRQIAAYYTSADITPVNAGLAYNASGNYLPHANPEYAIRTAAAERAPNVAAPPIRDSEGNIILDVALINPDNDNYIIVTAPNGEQTRISARFLQMLSSMNADIKPSDYFEYFIMGENDSGWKIRFNEWRNKLLQQVNFVPAATNFLDILELKDMLEEN